MKIISFTLLMILSVILSTGCNNNTTNFSAITNKIDSINMAAEIPMMQGAFLDNSQLNLFESIQEGYLPPAQFSETVFQAASLSKPIFATIVLKMAERGEIDLDTPLVHYIPLHRIAPLQREWANKLTAAMVLSHATGLPNWSTSPSSPEWPLSTLKFKFAPDSLFSYSGEAYYYLQQTIEHIAGKTLNQIAIKEIFSPLEMNFTSFEWGREDLPLLQYDSVAAEGYSASGKNVGQGRHPRANSAYTLRTTALDYSRFLQALFNNELLSAEWLQKMLTPKIRAQRYADKPRECDNHIFWGLGIGIENNQELGPIYFHWGDNGEFKALFIVAPSVKKELIYLTNSANGHSIIDSITPLFFQNKNSLSLSAWINERAQ